MTPRTYELAGIAENCRLQWQSARRHITDRGAADEAFRAWLLYQTRAQMVASGDAAREADRALLAVLGGMLDVCVADGSVDDAFIVCRWMVDAYVPDAETGSAAYDDALCVAFQQLHGRWLADRNTENNRQRTQAAIAVCDAIIDRWHDSPRDVLRIAVADSRLQKAKDCMEIGDEHDAEREWGTFVANTSPDDALLADRLFMAKHAHDALKRVTVPEPEFQTEWLDVQRRQDRKEGRSGNPATDYTDLAARLHAATTNLVRRSACVGDPPLVLLLQNFDIAEQAFVEGEGYSQTFHYRDGFQLINRLMETTWLVHVASTNAAGLEIDWYSQMILGRKTLRPLYLPHTDWRSTVRILASIAERIVIWAKGKTRGLLDEIDIVRQLGRTQDTVILLEDSTKANDNAVLNAALKVFLGKDPVASAPALTADDEILAGFPAVMMAAEMKRDDPDESPFVRLVAEAAIDAWHLSPLERVRRVHDRMARL